MMNSVLKVSFYGKLACKTGESRAGDFRVAACGEPMLSGRHYTMFSGSLA